MIEMRRVNAVRAQLPHRLGLIGDAKAQDLRRVPDVDGLDKCPGGKDAMADRADAAAVDLRALWVGDAALEEQAIRLRQLRERDHILPYLLGRRGDREGSPHRARFRLGSPDGLGG